MGKSIFEQNKVLKEVRSFLIITFGLLAYSFGYTALLIPAGVMGGGASGVGVIVYYISGEDKVIEVMPDGTGVEKLPDGKTIALTADDIAAYKLDLDDNRTEVVTKHVRGGGIPVGLSYLVLNAILLFIAVFVIGPKFGIKTIYAIGANSLILLIMQKNIDGSLMQLAGDPLLSAILGGALAGFGVALCLGQGGSSGGTDIVAMIINKYRDISMGKLIMAIDVVIICCSFFVFWEVKTVIYGFVTMAVQGYAIDLILSGDKQSTQITIFSSKSEMIAQTIIERTSRGVTLIDGMGAYTKSPQKVAVLVCRKYETKEFYKIIREIDESAFITVASVSGVYGKGFDALRLK